MEAGQSIENENEIWFLMNEIAYNILFNLDRHSRDTYARFFLRDFERFT